jgi:uncharacterized protein YecT (DUF1311 family)
VIARRFALALAFIALLGACNNTENGRAEQREAVDRTRAAQSIQGQVERCLTDAAVDADRCLQSALAQNEIAIGDAITQIKEQGALDFGKVEAAQSSWLAYSDRQCGILQDEGVDYRTSCLVQLTAARRDELERLIID